MFDSIVLPTLPPTEVLVYCAVIAAAVAVITAACYGPFLAVISERLAVARKRGFYTKLSQQIAGMNLFLAVAALASLGAGTAFTAMKEPALLAFPYLLPLYVTGAAAALSVILVALYAVLLPKKGGSGPGHICLGLLAGLVSVGTLFLSTGMVRRLAHTIPETDPALPWPGQLLDFFHIPPESFIWFLLGESVPLGLAFAAAFACLWLLLMRNREDFGRDYYAFALKACAKWALIATLTAIPVGALAFFQGRTIMLPELSHLPSLLLDALSVILPLFACLLWLLIIRSEHPMRRKISAALAALFLYAGFAAQILMFNKIIPSP